MKGRIKNIQSNAIHTDRNAGEDAEKQETERNPVFPETAEGRVIGYQYHPPKKTLRQKLREIIRILKS